MSTETPEMPGLELTPTPPPIPLPFTGLDRLLGGLRPGQLVAVGARSGIGNSRAVDPARP